MSLKGKNLELKLNMDDKYKTNPYSTTSTPNAQGSMTKYKTSVSIKPPASSSGSRGLNGLSQNLNEGYTYFENSTASTLTPPKPQELKRNAESQTSFPNYSELIKQGKIGKENNIMGSLGNNGSASKPVKLSAKHSGSINLDNDNTKIDRLDKGEKPSMNKNLEVNAMSSTTNSNIAPNTTKNINAPTLKNNKDEPISIMSLLGAQNYVPLDVNHINVKFDKYDQPKVSSKTLTDIRAYAANTNQGIVRPYNEDRVSIILNIVKPNTFTGNYWPKCSFFGIYDGHGGSSCADFLRDNLHQAIIRNPHFPSDPSKAIISSFELMEEEFYKKSVSVKSGKTDILNKSGSCAIIMLFVDSMCYIANLGDSRAIMSLNKGKDLKILTNDHKPSEQPEINRIIKAGGKVYQTQTNAKSANINFLNTTNMDQILVGPHRVFPGRLSVSRTIGDIEAKSPEHGGIKGVITHLPEIVSFKVSENMDYVLMGCDGIFDQLTNKEINECVWLTMNPTYLERNIHAQCGKAVDLVIKSSLIRKSLDNVTCLMVAFKNFEQCFEVLCIDKNKAPISSVATISNAPQTAKHLKSKQFSIQDVSSMGYNQKFVSRETNDIKGLLADLRTKDSNVRISYKPNEDYKVNTERVSNSYLENKYITPNNKPDNNKQPQYESFSKKNSSGSTNIESTDSPAFKKSNTSTNFNYNYNTGENQRSHTTTGILPTSTTQSQNYNSNKYSTGVQQPNNQSYGTTPSSTKNSQVYQPSLAINTENTYYTNSQSQRDYGYGGLTTHSTTSGKINNGSYLIGNNKK